MSANLVKLALSFVVAAVLLSLAISHASPRLEREGDKENDLQYIHETDHRRSSLETGYEVTIY